MAVLDREMAVLDGLSTHTHTHTHSYNTILGDQEIMSPGQLEQKSYSSAKSKLNFGQIKETKSHLHTQYSTW